MTRGENVVIDRVRTGLSDLRDVVRAFGLRGIAQRAQHLAKLRTGLYEQPGAQQPTIGQRPVRRLDFAGVRALYERLPDSAASAVADGERILTGEVPFFSEVWRETGWPPRWHHHVTTGRVWPSHLHWTELSTAGGPLGDVKWIWEPSRFAFVFAFARAFAADGDRRWPRAFWESVEDWCEHNPPFRGPNWMCGQETAIRAMAVAFGKVRPGGAHFAILSRPRLRRNGGKSGEHVSFGLR